MLYGTELFFWRFTVAKPLHCSKTSRPWNYSVIITSVWLLADRLGSTRCHLQILADPRDPRHVMTTKVSPLAVWPLRTFHLQLWLHVLCFHTKHESASAGLDCNINARSVTYLDLSLLYTVAHQVLFYCSEKMNVRDKSFFWQQISQACCVDSRVEFVQVSGYGFDSRTEQRGMSRRLGNRVFRAL